MTGVQTCALPISDHNREYVNLNLPDEMPKLERSLKVLHLDFNKIFDVEEVL